MRFTTLLPILLCAWAGLAHAQTATSTSNSSTSASLRSAEIGSVSAANLQNPWYRDAAKHIQRIDTQARLPPANRGGAKNIILFVGDGMGVSTVTAARILEGQNLGMAGEEHLLSFERLPHTAIAKTYNVDAQTPDSAGTMTALVTGVKTNAGLIGLSEIVARGDCNRTREGTLVSALELAELAGMATGIVSTSRITHATPAATYAKSPERNWEDSTVLPPEAKAAGCKDIAEQLIHFERSLEERYPGADVDGIEVALGGGRRHFLPADRQQNLDFDRFGEGLRNDQRDLIKEWKALYPKGQFIHSGKYLSTLDWSSADKVLGLFNSSHMLYETDRRNTHADEPSLSEMTEKAIERLKKNKTGYFLMVEAGRIDHAHHAGNAYNALMDTVEFAQAVSAALKQTHADDTLILVTADHSHVFTIAGYPKRGNPILGKVVPIGADEPTVALDNKPYTTLGYMNGLGSRDFENNTNADAIYKYPLSKNYEGRPDLSKTDTTRPGFHQESYVPLNSETHGGEDVVIYGAGPGAHLVTGTLEQNALFHIMEFAGDLLNKAAAGQPQAFKPKQSVSNGKTSNREPK